MSIRSRYPSFNVMNEKNEWDDHTQSIVTSRLNTGRSYRVLTELEAEMLRRICTILVDDPTPEVLDFVLHHIDHTLHKSPGESQRRAGVPEASALLREGLRSIEESARATEALSFVDMDTARQKQMLLSLSTSRAVPEEIWESIPQEPLFRKLLSLTIEAYCSHPRIWSDIGYAGPAYPRGYVRTELGLLDPWEAQPEQ